MSGKVSDMGDVAGTRRKPWLLWTPDGRTEFMAFRDPISSPPSIVVRMGKDELRYHLRSLNDLDEMLKEKGGWVTLGAADERTAPAAGSVEAWARSSDNPLGGWYGLTRGVRGRFAACIPPILEALDHAEIDREHEGGRMRAV
jgi:hypothetical protein